MSKEQEKQVLYLGYFCTILVALIVAPWLGDKFAGRLDVMLATDTHVLAQRLTAAFFFAICFANPSRAFVRSLAPPAYSAVGLMGALFGWLLQTLFIEMYVGDALGRIVMIAIAVLILPVMMVRDRRNSGIGALFQLGIGVIQSKFSWLGAIPYRTVFMGTMIGSFAAFSAFAHSETVGVLILGMMTIAMAISAATRGFVDPDVMSDQDEIWLTPDEIEEREAARSAPREPALVATLLGASFFGGMTWLSAQLVSIFFASRSPVGPSFTDQLFVGLEFGLYGFGVVLVGTIIAILVGTIFLQIIAHYCRWSGPRLWFAWWEMLGGLWFRPLERTAVN